MQVEPTASTGTISSGSQQRRNRNFFRRYQALCKAKNLQPLAELVNGSCGDGASESAVRHGRLKRSRLTRVRTHPAVEFYGDRLKVADWLAIIGALGGDTTLEVVSIRLRKVFGEAVQDCSGSRSDTTLDYPVILGKRLFSSLMDSLQEFLIVNKIVRVLTLEALPIQKLYMSSLINGLQQNHSITELSFARCVIHDEGCAAICGAVMHLPNIGSLNLSACQLSSVGCTAVAELIKYQKIQRFAESWECSLRYREIDTEKMQGLRHILLNANPRIGDEGLGEITEVLKDDEWIRQVQFRNCGLTNVGAKFIVDCLNINKTIKEFDIRGNAGISIETCREILVILGAEVETSDSSQSLIDGGIPKPIRMKPSEQIKCLQQQLAAERYRSMQLQRLIEQFRLQQTEFAVQMSKLQQDYKNILKEREDLQNRVQRLEKPRTASRKTKIRKSKSENTPTLLFSRNGSASGQQKHSTKSEMTLRWLNDRHVVRPGSATRRSQVLERTIGDCGLNAQLQGIQEVNEDMELIHSNYNEGGFGDMGDTGCYVEKKHHKQLNDQFQGDDDDDAEYHSDVNNFHSDEENFDIDYPTSDSGEDEDDEDGEISGANLLRTVASSRTPEQNSSATQAVQALFGIVRKTD